jgi:leucyl-tRNA synthetase
MKLCYDIYELFWPFFMINKSYAHKDIEKKFHELWDSGAYIQKNQKGQKKEKFYCLDMFPYPSSNGMHVGHWRGYVLSDVYTRRKWLQGFDILHPMGWDAFGLPAENYAIKNKVHPSLIVRESIDNFREQIKKIGALYDWSKEINTTDPEYYKWTQWIFLKMYEAGLAYEAFTDMNWCPSCLTGLANEEVVKGLCDRCGNLVEQKKIRQWMLKITDYAEALLEGLDKLDWPEKVKAMQRHWIGKSIGLEVTFQACDNDNQKIVVYTTRPETLYGVTFLGLSPSHPQLEFLIPAENRSNILAAIEKLRFKDNGDHLIDGIFIEQYAVHPITNELIPIYVCSYVLNTYGTGAVMGVPAHDSRDYAFAQLFHLPVKPVIQDPFCDNSSCYEGDGVLINSHYFDGMDAKGKGKKEISEFLIQKKIAAKKVCYKMRDWIFSRQRYWGEPIPLIHCKKCGIVPVPESQLPIELPYVERYEPTGDGSSPLMNISDWVNVSCFSCGGPAQRETNTMPQWAGSCWYFLRYPDPHNAKTFCSPELLKKWLPVDLYVGGIEHAILHLLYARFYVKFLHSQKFIHFSEPFVHLFNQGMVNKKSEKTGLIEKMSKSKGNVVNPDDIVDKYGTDALRLYILFMAPPEQDCQWQDEDLMGCVRFLKKFWHCMTDDIHDQDTYMIQSDRVVNRFLKQFGDRLDGYHTNTAVAAMMECVNEIISKKLVLNKEMKKKILITVSVIIPYTAAALLDLFFNEKLEDLSWQIPDETLLVEDIMHIVIQVNGKTRDICSFPKDTMRDVIEQETRCRIAKWLPQDGDIHIKTIYVKEKLINFVF